MEVPKFSLKYTLLYLIIAFSFSWILWGSEALIINSKFSLPLINDLSRFSSYGAWGPLIGAVIIALLVKRLGGIKQLLVKTFSLNFKKIWFIPTFIIFPLIIGLPLLFLFISGQSLPSLDVLKNPFVLPIAFFVILLTSGPLQEEYGWRGTLQLQFQRKINALFSSLLVGLIWGLWHLPLFFLPDQGFYYDKPIWGLVFSTTLISVLFGWIYNNTKYSMLLMLLFHTMFNFSHYIFPSIESDLSGQIYLLLIIISVTVVVFKTGLNLKTKKYFS